MSPSQVVPDRIVIAGATGFVGQQLACLFHSSGFDVLALTRSSGAELSFPDGISVQKLESIHETSFLGAKAFLNCIGKLPSSGGLASDYEDANVKCSKYLTDLAIKNQISWFFNIGTFASLEEARNSYSNTKLQAELELLENKSIKGVSVRVPVVYGNSYVRKMAFLDYLPTPLSNLALKLIGSVKPLVSVKRLHQKIQFIMSNPKIESGVYHVSDDLEQNVFYRFITFSYNFLLALVILIGFSWLLLIIGIAIYLTTGSNPIFVQTRVGKNAMPFRLIKFRTMNFSTPSIPTHEAKVTDVTPLGRWLRKLKLDELPQIFNVMCGTMRFVGPRPCLPTQTALIEERLSRGVYEIPPGITGLSQIKRIDMSNPQRLAQTDEIYVATRTIQKDLFILALTVLGSGNGDNAKLTRTWTK